MTGVKMVKQFCPHRHADFEGVVIHPEMLNLVIVWLIIATSL